MKNAREIQAVDRTLEILDSPEKWTKGKNARNKYGEPVPTFHNEAICHCLEGAIIKALSEQKLTDTKWRNSYIKITHALCNVLDLKFDIGHQDEHIGFNDHRKTTYTMVINALKKAKEYLSQ